MPKNVLIKSLGEKLTLETCPVWKLPFRGSVMFTIALAIFPWHNAMSKNYWKSMKRGLPTWSICACLIRSKNWSGKVLVETLLKTGYFHPKVFFIPKWFLFFLWGLEHLIQLLCIRNRFLTRAIITGQYEQKTINGSKIKSIIDFEYSPITKFIFDWGIKTTLNYYSLLILLDSLMLSLSLLSSSSTFLKIGTYFLGFLA